MIYSIHESPSRIMVWGAFMPEVVKRGYSPTDENEFWIQREKLRAAGNDLYYLLNRGYPTKPASVFVGNHYLLSERQRIALVRSIAPEEKVRVRRDKELHHLKANSVVYIDTFNTIISLEIAFSGSTLLRCMDGAIRDLAGLRGTYRLIDKTDMAAAAIRKVLEAEYVREAHFVIDAPVSNSGRLKAKLAEHMAGSTVKAEFEVIPDVDKNLYHKDIVITSDAAILDKCASWFNLVKRAIDLEIGEYPYIEIMESEMR